MEAHFCYGIKKKKGKYDGLSCNTDTLQFWVYCSQFADFFSQYDRIARYKLQFWEEKSEF